MKKILLISAVITTSFAMSNAQNTAAPTKSSSTKTEVKEEKQTPQAMAKDKVAEMNSICGLAGDQASKVTKLYVDFFTSRNALQKKKASLSTDEFKTKMAELKTKRNEGVKALLSPEQRAQLLKAKQEKANSGGDKSSE